MYVPSRAHDALRCPVPYLGCCCVQDPGCLASGMLMGIPGGSFLFLFGMSEKLRPGPEKDAGSGWGCDGVGERPRTLDDVMRTRYLPPPPKLASGTASLCSPLSANWCSAFLPTPCHKPFTSYPFPFKGREKYFYTCVIYNTFSGVGLGQQNLFCKVGRGKSWEKSGPSSPQREARLKTAQGSEMLHKHTGEAMAASMPKPAWE